MHGQGITWDSVNNGFIAPYAGIYLITFSIQFGGFGGQKYVRISTDGSTARRFGQNIQTTGESPNIAGSAVLSVSAGTLIKIEAWQASGSTQATGVIADTNRGTFAEITLLSGNLL
jgi:hypothetical protein